MIVGAHTVVGSETRPSMDCNARSFAEKLRELIIREQYYGYRVEVQYSAAATSTDRSGSHLILTALVLTHGIES